ncbi:thiamine-phosphate kinase [Leptolyngbya sp. NK1-12]|uniref:Thiamine-monophosphate kinase n=1 Tax=Leptolyngbya sp. NK1-12 TaxID=2547451 RepID=A0AA96WTE4_9CYAN|nr:thiamine-phosphate kinase [Leptolyngbya sp. NK1-12]WNZ22617.1 thiamine-phosphate kinase [Leptolyngbya sp. NK1-12]
MQVHQLGEQGLLKRLQEFCPIDLIGDDAALLSVAAGQSLVVTTDMLVDGVHFSDRTTSPFDAGWRATAANLSDLAAMGASPLGITIGLSLPGAVEVSWVEQFYQGIVACLQPYSTPIVGGDICRSSVITVSITAFGQVSPSRAIRRSTARPGDAILVTGVHGASRAGLELLLHPDQGQGLSAADRAALIQAHQRPVPRLDVVALLRDGGDAAPEPRRTKGDAGDAAPEPRRTKGDGLLRVAGMDSSDGLADAVLQICRASRVGAEIERNLIPFPPGLTAWVLEAQAVEWALYGGEDFELVLCLPRLVAQRLVEQLGNGAAIVGRITAEPKVVLRDRSGLYGDEILQLEKGFQHF